MSTSLPSSTTLQVSDYTRSQYGCFSCYSIPVSVIAAPDAAYLPRYCSNSQTSTVSARRLSSKSTTAAAMSRRSLSDLVTDSKIETRISGANTTHIFHAPGCSANERRVRREEQWVRQGFLGQGAFGTVFKERCNLGEGRGFKVRAVKEIRKSIADEEMDYTRELEAVMKFSNPRVIRPRKPETGDDAWAFTDTSAVLTLFHTVRWLV